MASDARATAKVVLCGDRWPAKEKLADNIALRLPLSAALSAHAGEICKALALESLAGWDVTKGKGKPPAVAAGGKLSLDKPLEEALQGKDMLVVYVREAAQSSPRGADDVKLLLCGDRWPAKEKLTDNPLVRIRRDAALSARLPQILSALALDSIDGLQVCRGKGKPPDVKPGPVISLDKTPAELGLGTVQVLYVRCVPAPTAAAPAPPAPAPPVAPACPPVHVDPAPPAAAAAAPAAEAKPDVFRLTLRSVDEQLGLQFHSIGGKMFVDGCTSGSPFCRAAVPSGGVLLRLNGSDVRDRDSLVGAIQQMREQLRASSSLAFDVEIDQRPEARFWLGAPVEAQVDREWCAGTVRAIQPDGTFDVHLIADDELATGVELPDIRLCDADIQATAAAVREKEKNSPTPSPLTPHVAADAPPQHPPAGLPLREGHLKKQGADIMGLYKTRRFALYESVKALYYFHPAKSRPLGVIDLRNSGVCADESRCTLELSGRHLPRVFRLQCEDVSVLQEWVKDLRKVGCTLRDQRGRSPKR